MDTGSGFLSDNPFGSVCIHAPQAACGDAIFLAHRLLDSKFARLHANRLKLSRRGLQCNSCDRGTAIQTSGPCTCRRRTTAATCPAHTVRSRGAAVSKTRCNTQKQGPVWISNAALVVCAALEVTAKVSWTCSHS